ncbi:MAG: hypothetical protein GC164_08615 [Phycisphaera sp.]|nr:hypothetical protein [Phycisphaera sp.]
MTRYLTIATLVTMCLACSLQAQETTVQAGDKPSQTDAAKAEYEKQLSAHKGDTDFLVLPGLVANKKNKTVELLTEATGLQANEIIEFLLVAQDSGHGYESLLWAFAKPSDVHKALEFIGLKPGSPIDPASGRFWSDGDPVILTVRDPVGQTYPIEKLLINNETNKALPAEGFLFTGSVMVPPPDGKGDNVYAADAYEPHSIASNFNDPIVVLDVPRQVSQGEVYGKQVVNPEHVLTAGQLITIVMTPGKDIEKHRGQQLHLIQRPDVGPTGVSFLLEDEKGKDLVTNTELTPVMEQLLKIKKESAPPYVTLRFDPKLPVAEVSKTCVLLSMLENILGAARVNPPGAGELYYRAFVPDKQWREAETRPLQPWELHLAKSADGVAAELVRYERILTEDVNDAKFNRLSYPVHSAKDALEQMAQTEKKLEDDHRSPMPAVLLVYADATLTYEQVMAYVLPLVPTHRTVSIFLENP